MSLMMSRRRIAAKKRLAPDPVAKEEAQTEAKPTQKKRGRKPKKVASDGVHDNGKE